MGFDAVVKFLHFHNIIRTCFQHTVLEEKTRLYGRNVRCASNWAARALGAERGSLDFRSFSSCKPLVLVSILLWAAAQNRHALLFPLGQNFHPKVTSGPRKNILTLLGIDTMSTNVLNFYPSNSCFRIRISIWNQFQYLETQIKF